MPKKNGMKSLHGVRMGYTVICVVCGQRKAPKGRSAPLELALCTGACPGYDISPFVGTLWPGELASDFGFPVGTAGTQIIHRRTE